MRSLCLSLLIICAVFSCRCGVTSLHPLYTEKELVLQPELVGLWATADGDTTVGITLVDAAQKAYRAEIAEESADPAKPFVFSVHFVDHDGLLFLDAVPVRDQESGNLTIVDFNLIPVHSFARVETQGETVRVTWMDYDWFEKGADAKRFRRLPTLRDSDGRVIITAPTKALQRFVVRYAKDKEAFREPVEFRRVGPAQ